jgi:hypothetical protein
MKRSPQLSEPPPIAWRMSDDLTRLNVPSEIARALSTSGRWQVVVAHMNQNASTPKTTHMVADIPIQSSGRSSMVIRNSFAAGYRSQPIIAFATTRKPSEKNTVSTTASSQRARSCPIGSNRTPAFSAHKLPLGTINRNAAAHLSSQSMMRSEPKITSAETSMPSTAMLNQSASSLSMRDQLSNLPVTMIATATARQKATNASLIWVPSMRNGNTLAAVGRNARTVATTQQRAKGRSSKPPNEEHSQPTEERDPCSNHPHHELAVSVHCSSSLGRAPHIGNQTQNASNATVIGAPSVDSPSMVSFVSSSMPQSNSPRERRA